MKLEKLGTTRLYLDNLYHLTYTHRRGNLRDCIQGDSIHFALISVDLSNKPSFRVDQGRRTKLLLWKRYIWMLRKERLPLRFAKYHSWRSSSMSISSGFMMLFIQRQNWFWYSNSVSKISRNTWTSMANVGLWIRRLSAALCTNFWREPHSVTKTKFFIEISSHKIYSLIESWNWK